MTSNLALSSVEQLRAIEELIRVFLLLPYFDGVPGAVMERIHAYVHEAKPLGTYDFIDVLEQQNNIGWQVKSTKKDTPVTWKRAKIPGKDALIEASRGSPEGSKLLGDAIINFCNAHVIASIQAYQLKQLIYVRLIDMGQGKYIYFERVLPINGILFDPNEFAWEWSQPKKTARKEQLPAFHGKHIPSGVAFFAWHGSGENQLHFKGEHTWWPKGDDPHRITFNAPQQRITLPELLEIMSVVLRR